MKRPTCRLGTLLLLLGLCVLPGCATRIEIGSPPRVDRLEQLTPNKSTPNDVLLLLGEPKGHGYSRLGPDLQRQRVWSYEYMLAEGEKIRTTILMVFFSGDVYEGYWWFGDALELKDAKGKTP
jgi:hypothetical protein